MVQLVALQARGTRYDPARVMADAERIRAGRIANESNDIALGQQRDEATALSRYRDAAQAGEPDAIGALDGYPVHQRKILDALDGMTGEEAQAALGRAREINEAANYVASFPQGPDRDAAWGEQLGELQKKGYVTPEQASAWIEQGPSDLMLQDAISTTSFVLGQYGSGKSALNNAKIETEQARRAKLVAEAENTTGPKRDKILAEIERIDAQTQTEGKRGDKIVADTDLSRARGETEVAKQGKYGAETGLAGARTKNVEADTAGDTALSKAKVGKAVAETDLSKARTGQVTNKTALETAQSGAKVDETKAKTGRTKADTRRIEADIQNEKDIATARIADYEASARTRGNTKDGSRGDVTVRDQLAVDEAIAKREKELGLDFPLPDDATPEEVKEREAAEAKFEAYKDVWLARLGEKGPSGKQGPAGLNADTTTTPGKAPAGKLKGAGTDKDPYSGFSREEFNQWPAGTVFINPKDGRLLKKKAPNGAGP